MRRTTLARLTVVLALPLALTACGGDDNSASSERPNDPKAVSVAFIDAWAADRDCDDAADYFADAEQFLDQCNIDSVEEGWSVDRESVTVDINDDEDEAEVEMTLTSEDSSDDAVEVDLDLNDDGDWVVTGVQGRFFA